MARLQYKNLQCIFYLFFTLLSVVSSMTVSPTTTTKASSGGDMQFAKFKIAAEHIFLRTKHSAAFVNLRPIVPGHVLVMPNNIVPTLEELSTDEYTDLWLTVRHVQAALKQHYKAQAFNVAVQDGKAAGQSVPHVHVHILPRNGGDFERNDDVYDALEAWVPQEGITKEKAKIDVPDDEDRKDRTVETMATEAAIYRDIIQESSKL